MKKVLLNAFALLALTLFSAQLHAQGRFVYTNDDVLGPNTVSAFRIEDSGAVTLITGSPFSTGGLGSAGLYFSSVRILVVGDFLYVSNGGSNDVSVFSIDPNTGYLTPIQGSPFATGGSASMGMSLAATPDGKFLYVVSSDSNDIRTFSIEANGGLAATGSPVSTGPGPDGVKLSADGKFLAVVLVETNPPSAVAMFKIDSATGALTAVQGSPFSAPGHGGPGSGPAGVEINCAGNTLYLGEASFGPTIVDVLGIGSDGKLTPASAITPAVGLNSNVLVLNPDGKLLFVSNQGNGGPGPTNTVTVFQVGQGGKLTLVAGSPFAIGGGAFFPAGLATSQKGDFLYVASSPNLVGVFRVAGSGALTAVHGSPFSTGQAPGLGSLAAYPPPTCSYSGKKHGHHGDRDHDDRP